jgi:hypothetical protein
LSEPGATNQRAKLRIENLSDLVFGLALSLGSVILVSRSVQTPSDLVTNVVLFGFSFIIVIWIWSGYTRTMSVLPFEIRGTYILNIALLFGVAIEPYLFYVLFQPIPTSSLSSSLLGFASSLYALDSGAMMFILAGLAYMLLNEVKARPRRIPGFSAERSRRIMYAQVASGSIFWASALPFFWIADPFGSVVRFDLWYFVFVTFFGVFRIRRNVPQTDPGQV